MDSPRQTKGNTRSSGDEEDENTSAIDSNENEEIDSELSDSEARSARSEQPAADRTVMYALLFLFAAVILGYIYGLKGNLDLDGIDESMQQAKDKLRNK